METVHRYTLPITDRVDISLPLGAQVLTAPPTARNRDSIEIWALVNTAKPEERRSFRIVGTGKPLPDDCGRFIGTVMTHSGAYVWHVFEAVMGVD